MIGIKAIASYVPEHAIDNLEQARKFGESDQFIREKIGALRLPRLPVGAETSDIAAAALDRLFASSDLGHEDVEALVVVTQNGDGRGLPHTSAIVQHKAGLRTALAAFDVSLGCSGYVYGLSIVKGLMATTGMSNAVLVTADPYSKIINLEDRVTALLFGDAATATWVGQDAEWEIGTPMFGTDGAGAGHLTVADGAKLVMNGRQVFNFASMKVPKQISEYLSSVGIEPDEVDVFCLHQGSASIVSTIARRFPSASHKFVCDMQATGNTVSSSIPLLLERFIRDPGVATVLISGFGVGLSWATTILTRRS